MKKSIIISILATLFFIFFCTNATYAMDLWSNMQGKILTKEDDEYYLNEYYAMLEDDNTVGEFDYEGRYVSGKEDYAIHVQYTWLHNLTPLLEQIAQTDLDTICNDNDRVSISHTKNTIEILEPIILNTFLYGNNEVTKCNLSDRKVVLYNGSNAVKTHRSKEAFKKITNSDPEEYVGNKMYPAMRKLNAAYDKKFNIKASESSYSSDDGDKVCINDNYETKFRYTYNQIKAYREAYGDELNLDETSESNLIKRVWDIKTGLKVNIDKGNISLKKYEKVLTRKDLYVAETDSYSSKMCYDIEQIWLYEQLYYDKLKSNNYGWFGTERRDTLIAEWKSMDEEGKHTAFFNKYADYSTPGHVSFPEDEFNKDDLGTANNLDSIKKVEEDGKNYYNEHKNDLSSEDAQNYEEQKNKADDISGEYHHPTKVGDTSTGTTDEAMQNADNFIDSGSNDKINSASLQDLSNSIYNIALIAGIVIAVLVGAILGIKFMTGSVEEKADVKKLLIPYVVGCVVIFGAFGIWKLVVTILSGI